MVDETDAEAARDEVTAIVPGLLTAGLLTHLGGLWAFLATEMHFEFVAPVYIGDTITAETEVVERERGLMAAHRRQLAALGAEGAAGSRPPAGVSRPGAVRVRYETVRVVQCRSLAGVAGTLLEK